MVHAIPLENFQKLLITGLGDALFLLFPAVLLVDSFAFCTSSFFREDKLNNFTLRSDFLNLFYSFPHFRMRTNNWRRNLVQ